MTVLGLAAFFGLALVTIDIVGGIAAAAMLARGMRTRRLLIFAGAYTVAITAALALMLPLIARVKQWLHPVLGSELALGTLQVLAAIGLIGLGLYELRSANRPVIPKAEREVKDRTGSLITAGVVLAATTCIDPAFPIAVGMVDAEPRWPIRILLLIAWNLVYNLPLLAMVIASALGMHTRMLRWIARVFAPHRRALLLTLAALLIGAGVIVLGDSILAMLRNAPPWLFTLVTGEATS